VQRRDRRQWLVHLASTLSFPKGYLVNL
jgi:hypothetical protein